MYSNQFVKLWSKISRDLRTYMETQLAPTLTEGQLNVLEVLLAQDQMKPSDLLEHLNTTPAAVTTLLDRMEKNELIVRQRDEKDRRIVWIIPTEKGKSECARGVELRNEFIHSQLDRISSHNQQLLVYLLGKVAN
ncbi:MULTISPECIES: MarR family winged helix-turn-helix transcriptional regulator [Paenibacillus]|uniref:MarR family transcriptional regulator n=1 Tax=Paenibacillus oceani TaxID=2772510 RepID=A0A927C708_9BACL|nr:MarR family transcriptional regulator [Paenibacillus oceani]MBD2861187.1 MarR family transcriptional regulator [Paenibacillus oceani]MDF2657294.1 transcriptional regulator [Paenibacillus sp.]